MCECIIKHLQRCKKILSNLQHLPFVCYSAAVHIARLSMYTSVLVHLQTQPHNQNKSWQCTFLHNTDMSTFYISSCCNLAFLQVRFLWLGERRFVGLRCLFWFPQTQLECPDSPQKISCFCSHKVTKFPLNASHGFTLTKRMSTQSQTVVTGLPTLSSLTPTPFTPPPGLKVMP